MQTVTPYLLYADVDAALAFLSDAFGFEETVRYTGAEGYVSHAEMQVGDGTIMLGDPGDDYRNPKALGASTAFTHVYVEDVDAACERARSAGAEIIREPEDQPYGDRNCGARDPEGHEWWLATHIRDVPVEEWSAALASGEGASA
jgi:PhnB protein